MQEAAIQRARLEAESTARLAELSSRQEHERQLHAIKHDKSRKGLQLGLAGAGVLLLALAVGGGVVIAQKAQEADRAKAELQQLETQKDAVEADKRKLENDLANAPDKATAAAAQAALAAANAKLADIMTKETAKKPTGGGGAAPAKPSTTTKAPCNCQPGDPLCSCL